MTHDSEAVALKPCPFCGGVAVVQRFGNRKQSTIYECTECACVLETGEERDFGRAWNTRPDAPAAHSEGLVAEYSWTQEECEISLVDAVLSVWAARGGSEKDIADHPNVRTAIDRLTTLREAEAVRGEVEGWRAWRDSLTASIEHSTREQRGGPQFPEVHRARIVYRTDWAEGQTPAQAESRLPSPPKQEQGA